MNEYSFINEILIRKKPAIIVEGNDDITFFENLFNFWGEDFIIISPENRYARNRRTKGGKGEVIKIIDFTYKNYGYLKNRSIIGIVDADFNHLVDVIRKRENLFLTDTHDIETQIVSSMAFKKFVNSFYEKTKKRNWTKDLDEIRDYCIKKTLEYSIWIYGLYKVLTDGISREDQTLYHKLSIYKKIKKNIGDIKEYIQIDKIKQSIIINDSKIDEALRTMIGKEATFTKSEYLKIKKLLSSIKKKIPTIDPYQCVSGHDLLKIVSIISLLKMFDLKIKGMKGKQFTTHLIYDNKFFYFYKEIETKLRSSYELSHFKESQLYKQIIRFNSKYVIT